MHPGLCYVQLLIDGVEAFRREPGGYGAQKCLSFPVGRTRLFIAIAWRSACSTDSVGTT
jgi:hypothetical protein